MFRTVNSRGLRAAAAGAVLAASFVLGGCGEIYNRDDFATRVKDKSEQEVVKEIGKPSIVDKSTPARVSWTYTSRTFSIENQNKVDAKTVVVFSPASSDGKLKVTEVLFE